MSGNIGLAPDGELMLNDTYGMQFLIELYSIADQTFAGGYYFDFDPYITVGNGDYSDAWYTGNPIMTIPWGEPAEFYEFGFGQIS